MRRTYSSRRLAELCQRDVACIYLVGRATPDFHTISEFRQRFTKELQGLFLQVLLLCREAGLVRLGHVSLDGTEVRRAVDLEHWAAFQTSFTRLSTLVTEVASGRSSRVLIQALYFARLDNNTLRNVLF